MGEPIVLVLSAFNRLHKKMNVIYHDYAKKIGLSDAAFWLLYSLYEYGHPCTQRDLCNAWFYAPQTINSALKALEEKGLIALEPAPKNRKNKLVHFTQKGEAVVKETIDPLVQAELSSFMRLDEKERFELMKITQRHIELLEEEINKINIGMSSEDTSSQ